MGSGMLVRKLDGTVVADTSSIFGMFLGSFQTGGGSPTSGTITDSRLTSGTPFYYVSSVTIPAGGNQFVGQTPVITFSGNTLSYSWDSGGGTLNSNISAVVMYGIK